MNLINAAMVAAILGVVIVTKSTVFIRSNYNYNVSEVSAESGLRCEDVSRTQQHFRDECDINTILTKFNVTGVLPENPLPPRYGDFSDIGDYHSALNAVRLAATEFALLPAALRARFDNDPASLLDFLAVEANRSEAIDLGLIPKVAPIVEPIKAAEAASTVTPT